MDVVHASLDLWLDEGWDDRDLIISLMQYICMLVQLIMQLYNYHMYCRIKCNYTAV